MFIRTALLFILLLSAFVGACTTMDTSMESKEPLRAVPYVDLQKIMGDWYVIANIPTFIEEGAANSVESYSWNEKEQRIDVEFHFNKWTPDGEIKRYPQKAWVFDKKTNAEWRVQPWWPLKFAYLVIDLAPDYSYAVTGVPNRKYVWILARKTKIDDEIFQQILERLKAVGYDTAKIQKVPQVWFKKESGQ